MQKANRENSKVEILNSKQLSNSNETNPKKYKKLGIIKAAVLDLDVHTGNGTQEIFYEDPTVLTVSIHQDPAYIYPGTGFLIKKAEERGKGTILITS